MSAQVGALIVAVIAALVSVIAAIIAARGQRTSGLAVAELASGEREQALLDRYQEPLIRAANDLQSRLFNILERSLLRSPDDQREYIETSTVWLFGQYFGWVEILRREAQFLQLPLADDKAKIQRLLGEVARICASDGIPGRELQIQRSQQRALGELMVIRGRDAEGRPRSDCLGFAAFTSALEDERGDVHKWYSPLRVQVWPAGEQSDVRLRLLQNTLVDLIDEIDPGAVRFPEYRGKAPLPA